MEPYVRNDGLSIKIVDFEGESIGATDVTLKFAYKYETSKAYGGYERKDLTNATTGATITLVLKADADGKVFTQDTDITFLYAGEYETTLSIKVGNTGYTYSDTDSNANGGKLPAKTPTFKVWSEVPTVYISDISLDGNGAYAVDLTKSGYLADTETHTVTSSGCSDDYKYTCHIDTQKHIFAGDNKNYISKIETDNLTAWLFFKCNHTSTVKDYDGGTSSNALNRGAVYIGHTYSYNNGEGVPRADLTLSGMGNASNAKLTFAKSDSGDVIMITQYTADRSGGTYWGDYSSFGTDSYEWSNDGVCKRFIGVMDNGAGKNNSDTKTVADTITADTLVLTHDGVEYSFNIPTITIHNPY